MTHINRRQWLQKSLLASTAMLVAGPAGALAHTQQPKANKVSNGLIQLNWNENPYGPSEKALKAVTQAIRTANRYPDAVVSELKKKMAGKYGLTADQILLTAGSTEVLSLLGQHVGLQKGEILTPWPSFPTMIQFGEACGAGIRKVPLHKKDQLDLNRLKDNISEKTSLIFVCNPNNPTSTEVAQNELRSFLREVPQNVLICVDEAYIEYSKKGAEGSVIDLVSELPNLIICRTFSKAYGLAGLRIGYAVSNSMNIDALRQRHIGWELSAGIAPLSGAMAALDDDAFLKKVIRKNEEGRQILYKAFKKWGVNYNASSTNFVYARSEKFKKNIVSGLAAQNILITKWPDMTHHIRISIGKPEEMRQFVEAAESYLA
jgi:histidinol-phosphate aminotransferase